MKHEECEARIEEDMSKSRLTLNTVLEEIRTVEVTLRTNSFRKSTLMNRQAEPAGTGQ